MKTMSKPLVISLIMGMLMALSGAFTRVMTHPNQPDGHQATINLETIIPREFDQWKIDLATAAIVVNPDDKSLLNKIYNQTISRTYINNKGEQVMLSIAYGRDQSSDLHVHRPEICYATSGFDISDMTKTFVDTSIGRIPVMHLVAKQGNRNEPITYWIRVGDSLTRGWFEQKFAAIAYGLSGKAPDGLLLRVSTISNNEQESYRVQQAFLAALLPAVRSEDRYWLVGHLNP
jgi:EpsI family protein